MCASAPEVSTPPPPAESGNEEAEGMHAQFSELLLFVSDKREEVVSAALDAVLGVSENPQFTSFLLAQPNRALLRPLLRILEKEEEGKGKRTDLVLQSLQVLINLSSVEALSKRLTENLNAVSRLIRCLDFHRHVSLHCMLLANLTRNPPPCSSSSFGYLEEKGLFKALVLKYCSDESAEVDLLGAVIVNASVLEGARRELCEIVEVKGGGLRCVLIQCLARVMLNRRRRNMVLQILQNLALDEECHDAFHVGRVVSQMAIFLYPEGKVEEKQEEEKMEETKEGEESKEQAPKSRRREKDILDLAIVDEGIGLAADVKTRELGATVLICLSRSFIGREAMRAVGLYEVVRLWHEEEEDTGILDMLETLASIVHYSEEEWREEDKEEEEEEAEEEKKEEAPPSNPNPFDFSKNRPIEIPSEDMPLPKREEEAEFGGLFDGLSSDGEMEEVD